jgi:deaminated glutathione amidase
MKEAFKVAAVQMVSEPSVVANLDAAGALVAEAAGRGARLVVLPEWFCLMGRGERDKLAIRERDGDGPIQSFLAATAAKHGVWVIAGTVPLFADDPEKVRNTSVVYDAAGRRVARYDKIHLFDFTGADEQYRESNTIEPGDMPVAIDSPFGRVALSICYDVRFPELYRRLAPMDLITVPSAFTATTGAAHWEILIRARAVENLAWVIAPAQGGEHASGRRTHGHTMIVDPWGKVAGSLARGPGVVVAEIDPQLTDEVRASLPALGHRVL